MQQYFPMVLLGQGRRLRNYNLPYQSMIGSTQDQGIMPRSM